MALGRSSWSTPLCALVLGCYAVQRQWGKPGGRFQATYLETAPPGSSLLSSAKATGPALSSDSPGGCKWPHTELCGPPSGGPSLGFFGGFGGWISSPGLETGR